MDSEPAPFSSGRPNWPVIPTDQNGSGEPTSLKEWFDLFGNNTWVMDERGFLTRNTYDIPTGTRGGLRHFRSSFNLASDERRAAGDA